MKQKWMRKGAAIVLAMTMAIAMMGCAGKAPAQSTEETSEPAESFQGEYLISPEEAAELVGSEDVIFVDARGSKQAIMGTVDGAIATTWQELCTCQEGAAGDEGWGKIPEAEDLAKRLGDLGLAKDKQIIFIGETLEGWGDDGRLLWEFVAAGYENVKMIDGGYKAAKAAGIKTQHMASKLDPVEVTIDEIDNTHVMETEELQANYDQYVVVDVRTDEEYNGEVLYGEAKGGHLPGAIHVRYTDLFQENGKLKMPEEIIAMFEEAGVNKEDKVVAYCTGGIRSAYVQLVLEMCGYENTWNYDQSYWRWCVVNEVE